MKLGYYGAKKLTKIPKHLKLENVEIINMNDDPIEFQTNQAALKKYESYTKIKPSALKKLKKIVAKIIEKNPEIDTFVELTLGSGKIAQTMQKEFGLKIIAFEANKKRAKLFPNTINRTVKTFTKDEIKSFDKNCIIHCDPSWGGWEIVKYDYSLLGYGNYQTMRNIIEKLSHANFFIFNLPKNYIFDDFNDYKTEINVTGRTNRIAFVSK